MRFYPDKDRRYLQAFEILYKCQESRGERATHYRNWQNTYLNGSHTGVECKDNQIKPIIDQLSSFLYAPESCSFWADLGPQAMVDHAEIPPEVLVKLSDISSLNELTSEKLEQILEQIQFDRIDSVIDSINDSWVDTDIDNDTGLALTNSLIEGCAIIKLIVEPHRGGTEPKNSIYAAQVHPGDFGVYRPDEIHLTRQQAFCHTTTLSLPEILVRVHNHPNRTQILQGLETASSDAISSTRIFPTSATPTSVTGAPLGVFTGRFDYNPRQGAQLFQVHELYCWDDFANDYRVFQISGNNVILENFMGGIHATDGRLLRRGMGIKGRSPFIKICPLPRRDYFWGYSLVEGLTGLQNWYSQRINQLDLLLGRVLQPPHVLEGAGGMDDELREALNSEGGLAMIGQPGAKITEFKREVPKEAIEIIREIRDTFYTFASLRPSLFGKSEPGTRTEGMLAGLLRVAAAPTRKIALVVEKQIEELASLLFHYKRHFQDDELSAPDGTSFYLSDFPESVRIRVDGHSSCPLFAEDHLKVAEAMWRMGVLTPSMAVDLIGPPRAGQIKFSQKKIEFAKLVAQQVMQQRQQEKRSGKDKS